MAKIFISYVIVDRPFVTELAKRLQSLGHTVFFDSEITPGVDWRQTITAGLKASDVLIAVFSKNTEKSSFVLTELGAARAYAAESGRMLVLPLIIDDMPLPPPIQDIQGIFQPDQDLSAIIPTIERAISAFIGRRAAMESAEIEQVEKIQSNAATYVRLAIDSLARLEKRDRLLSHFWYSVGFVALVIGISFALWGLSVSDSQADLSIETLILVALKAVVVVGLLGACARYAFSLGKSYSGESLKSSDRIHAIRFGEFYLRAYGDKTKWAELKEVFQHWNIDRNSSFSSLDVAQFDPKIIEPMLELVRIFREKTDVRRK